MKTPTIPTVFSLNDIISSYTESKSILLFKDDRNDVFLHIKEKQTNDFAELARISNGDFSIIVDGSYTFFIENQNPIKPSAKDIVYIPKGMEYYSEITSDKTSGSSGSRLSIYPKNTSSSPAKSPNKPNTNNEPPNMLITSYRLLTELALKQRKYIIIENDINSLFSISDSPKTSSQGHWHFDFDEWWYIPKGNLEFRVGENRPLLKAKAGDVVYVPKGFRHQITTIGTEPSIRMPVTTLDNVHIWTDEDDSAPPPKH